MLLKTRLDWMAKRQPAMTKAEALAPLTKFTADQLVLHGFSVRTKPGYVLIDLNDSESEGSL